jgi:hypothetical protein
MPIAWVSTLGPEVNLGSSPSSPRLSRIVSIPSTGSSARIKTASALPRLLVNYVEQVVDSVA